MASYTVTGPDGRKATVTAPDDATQDDALQYAMDNWDTLAPPPKPPEKPGVMSTIGMNALAGAAGTVANAGSAIAGYMGADDVSGNLKASKEYWDQQAKDYGGDTMTGKVSNLVGGILPSLIVPEGWVPQLLGNATLFAIPAFKDTYEQKIKEGNSEQLALSHAALAAGINLFAPSVATKGSKAISSLIGKGEGAVKQLGLAAGEGAAFSAADTAAHKGLDVAAGQANDQPWLDPQGMAVNALGFPILRAAGMLTAKRKPAEEVKPPAAEPPPEAAPEAPPAPVPRLGYTDPDPLLSFPDGSVARRSEVEAHISKLPEDQQVAARAAMSSLKPQPARPEPPPAAPPTEDPAIAKARQDAADQQELQDLVQSEARNKQAMQAQINRERQKQQQMDALQAQTKEQLGRTPDQQVAAARAATDETPTAMQLAMQRAREKQADSQPPKTPDVTQTPEAQQAAPQQQAPAAATTREPLTPEQVRAKLASNIAKYQAEQRAKAAAANAPPAPAAPEPLRLGNTDPDPMLTFRDGTVARRSEMEAYINKLPPDQQVAARAKFAGLEAQPAAEPATRYSRNEPDAEPAQPTGPVVYGKNNVPLTDGGKPFKTNSAASDARKGNAQLRVQRVEGGYALREITEAEQTAMDAAAKRIRNGNTSAAGEPIHAHGFIAGEGGLSPLDKPNMGIDKNVKIGNRWLYGAEGKGLSIEQATEKLKEHGYLPPEASHDDARNLIKKSIQNPQYTAEGTEHMAARELESRRQMAEAAEHEAVADLEPVRDNVVLAIDDADIPWDAPVSNTSQADAMRALGFDEQEINHATAERPAGPGDDGQGHSVSDEGATTATPGDIRGREGTARADSPGRGQEQDGLSAPTREEILSRQDQTAANAREARSQRSAEQERERQENERKEIAQRSVKAADTFELGGDADKNLSGQGDMFSRKGGPGKGMSIHDVRTMAERVKTHWPEAPDVVVAKNIDDPVVPKALRENNAAMRKAGAKTDPDGVWHDGKIYLFADHLKTPADVGRVMSHETLGHVGLQGHFGDSLKAVLDKVIEHRGADVLAKMREYGLDAKNADHRREAAEELLAEMAEKTPQAGLVKRAVGAIRAWFRERVPGFDKMGLSDNDIITQYILPARKFIERGQTADNIGKAVVKYSRPDNQGENDGQEKGRDSRADGQPEAGRQRANEQDLPTTIGGKPASSGWAEATRIRGKNGAITVYRGAKTPLEAGHFEDKALGKASGNPSSGLGVWFTSGKHEAATYGKADAYHLDLRNPKLIYADKLPGFDSTQEAAAYRKKLQAQGHDGLLISAKHLGKDELHMVAFHPDQVIPAKPVTRYSREKIVGASDQDYTPEQRQFFKNTGRMVTEQTMKERVADFRKNWAKKTTQAIADQFAPVKELTQHGYTLLRLSRGAPGALHTFLNTGKLRIEDGAYNSDTSGGVIQKVFQPLRGEADDFLWWVAAHRAEHLAKQDREHLFTDEDIAAGKSLANGQLKEDYVMPNGTKTRDRAKAYADTLRKFDGFNKNALDMAEQSGLIDKESRKYWEHEFYVPFYRATDDNGTFAGANIKQGAVRQVAFKALKGGADKLHSDLMTNTLQNWGHLIDASAKNRAAQEVLKAAEAQGIATSANEATVKAMGRAADASTVWVMNEGTKQHYVLDDPYIATALQALEYAGMKGPLWKALSAPKHWLTLGVTASPGFKIRNLIRDSLQAMSVGDLSYNPIKNIKQGIEATKHGSQTYASAMAGGGLIHFGTMLEGNAAERTRRMVKMGIDESNILDTPDKLGHMRNRAEKILTAYNELGNRGEEINRAALYQQLRSKGIGHAEASLAARDLLDFSMQGSSEAVRILTQVVPFLNARIQGLYKLGRGAQENPARFTSVLLATTGATLALLAYNHDDEDFKKLDDYQRDNYWWVKMGGLQYAIPKPFEIGSIATLAERGVELFTDKEMTSDRFLSRVKSLLANNLNMDPTPQSIKPLMDIYANRNSFKDAPINPMGMEKLAPDYRFNGGTSMVARGISTGINKVTNTADINGPSPLDVDYAIQAYFGWVGSLIVGTPDWILRGATNQPSQPTPDYYKQATQGFANQLPTNNSRYVTDLYKQAQVIEQAYGTYQNLLKNGKTDDAMQYFTANMDKIQKYKQTENVKQQMTKLNQAIHQIESGPADSDTKRAQIQQIKAVQNQLAKTLAPA